MRYGTKPYRRVLPGATAVAVWFTLGLPLSGQGTVGAPAAPLIGMVGQNAAMAGDPAMLTHSQGYLGVGVRDVDTSRAAQLKLKDARGAEIVTVDHDAPAASAGLKIHDVILGMNNQPIDGQAQLAHMLREMPAGKVVTFLISRDGKQQTVTVQLADRATIEADAWSQHIPVPQPEDAPLDVTTNGPVMGNGFLSSLGANPLYTGLDLDALGPQLAGYFGVQDGVGLLVRRVDESSPGSAAGLRAGDVITKVNGQAVTTTSQWFRAIHANRGKQVQLTVIRQKHVGTVNMLAGHPKTKGKLEWPNAGHWGSFPVQDLDRPMQEALNAGLPNMQALADQAQQIARQLESSAFRQKLQDFEQQMEQLPQLMQDLTPPNCLHVPEVL